MKEMLRRRTMIVLSAIIIITIVFLCIVVYRSSIMTGMNPDADEMKQKMETYLKYSEVTEGNIVDKKGQVLSKANKPGKTGDLVFPRQYSWLIGYVGSSTYKDSNFVKKEDQRKNYYAIKGKYIDYLYKPGDKKGATLKLTIDNNTQLNAYSKIKGRCASVVVLEYKTGKIRCLANSQPVEYNVNDNSVSQWKEINKVNGFFVPNYLNPKEPGSVFKVVTAAAMIENNKDYLQFPVKPVQHIANHDIKNVSRHSWNSMTLEQALGYSSNTYFAQAALEVGGSNLEKIAKKYKLGKKMNLFFTDIKSNFDLEGYDEDKVADAAYGQGNTLITPIHLAMIYQSIANKGNYKKPYLMEDIIYDGDSILPDDEYDEREVDYKAISKKTASKLKKMLKKNVDYYYGRQNSVKNLHAKTGTSQITGEYKYRKTIASFDKKYVVIITEDSNKGYGIDLWDDLQSIYKALY